ncbi:MAG: hypothetical protein KGM42_19120 [Hyphomicrobiales bacterium]|nr:hypothetical protein [Hyphomicrobiales bacterium]
MGEKSGSLGPEDAAAPSSLPERRGPTSEEVLVEIDACALWHAGLGFTFGGVHNGAQGCAQSRIAGHVIEAGEDGLHLVDRPVIFGGVAPCGHADRCWTDGKPRCPNNPGDVAAGTSPERLLVPANEVAATGERLSRTTAIDLDPFEDR